MTKLLQMLGLPEVASAHGHALDDFTAYVHLLMLLLFLGWGAFFVAALLKFNRKSNPKADYVGVKSHMSTYVEIGVAVIEAVLLVGFAIPLWAKAVDHFPKESENPVVLQVMAQQFAWNAHYAGPDGKWGKQDIKYAGATSPFGMDPADADGKDDVITSRVDFLLPVNRPAICKVSSMDVIHSFKIPAMRVTQDAIPGMSIPVHFTPTKTGDYYIICAQLCGNGHATMRGTFKVVSQDEYTKWINDEGAKAKASGGSGGFE